MKEEASYRIGGVLDGLAPRPPAPCGCALFRKPRSGKKCADCFGGDPDDEGNGMQHAVDGEYCQNCGHPQGCGA